MKPSLAARMLILPIRGYQRFISRYTPPTCRYYPCCSNYAITALYQRGALLGTALTVWRLLRCNPWSSGGVDHVPARRAPGRAGENCVPEPDGPQSPAGRWPTAAATRISGRFAA